MCAGGHGRRESPVSSHHAGGNTKSGLGLARMFPCRVSAALRRITGFLSHAPLATACPGLLTSLQLVDAGLEHQAVRTQQPHVTAIPASAASHLRELSWSARHPQAPPEHARVHSTHLPHVEQFGMPLAGNWNPDESSNQVTRCSMEMIRAPERSGRPACLLASQHTPRACQ